VPRAIVLADDEPTVRLILLRMLAAVAPGYELIAVGTGHDALAAVGVRPVALLITDYNMPGMNGAELTQHVKATAPATTIVLLTAHVTVELEQRGKAAGVDYFLAKPFSFDQLVAIVRKALGYRARKHTREQGCGRAVGTGYSWERSNCCRNAAFSARS